MSLLLRVVSAIIATSLIAWRQIGRIGSEVVRCKLAIVPQSIF